MGAKVNNPRKQFQFSIIIAGMNPFLVQECTTADSELDAVEHGDTNFDVKTAGRKKIGMLRIRKICPSEFPDSQIRNWMKTIQNTLTGGGLLPSLYKRNIIVEQYAPDGITVLERWEYSGCWPQKLNGMEFNRRGSENTIETIDFCVDEEI